MKKIIFLVLSFICIQHATHAQNLFDVTEKDTDGNWENANDKGYKNNLISDINSTLHIDFLKENIILSTDTTAGVPKQLFDKIVALRAALDQQKNTLNQIDAIIKTLDYTNLADLEVKLEKLQIQAKIVDDIEKIDPRIEQKTYEIGTGATDEMYRINFQAAAIVLKEIEKEVDDYAADAGISIKFGGWLVTKNGQVPLHIEGFDHNAPQEHYEVERWMLTPTENQLEEMKKMQQLAKENKDTGLAVLKDLVTAQVDALKNIGISKYQKYVDSLNKAAIDLEANATLAEFRNKLTDFNSHLKEIKDEAASRSLYYKNIIIIKEADLPTLLAKIKDDTEYLKKEFESIKTEVTALKIAITPTVISVVSNIQSSIEKLEKLVVDDIKFIKNLSEKKDVINFLIYGRELDIAALQFSELVLKQSLSDVKKSFDFDLEDSGVRHEGDRIIFKMAVYKPGSEVPVKEQNRVIYLFKVLTHTVTTVGVVFNDPFTKTKIESNFQMAPYYHLLFKGFLDKKMRRKSVVYNRIFDWGIGLHVCSPDFNKDDVPELGVGTVISGLHDYLQTGIGYNIFTGDPYWFFGIRIPTPSFGSNRE